MESYNYIESCRARDDDVPFVSCPLNISVSETLLT